MQLEQQYSVKWSLLELMSALSVHTLKCLLTRACSSSANTSHRIILSPVFSSPWQGEERLIWAAGGQKTPNKDLAQTNFNTVNLTWTLVSWCFCFCLPWMCPCQPIPMKMIKNVLNYMSPCLCRAQAADSGERNLRFLELILFENFFQSFFSTRATSCHKRALLPSIFPSDVLRLPLLCGIPYSKLIKTIQLIVAPDNKGREHAPQGSQILKHSLSI